MRRDLVQADPACPALKYSHIGNDDIRLWVEGREINVFILEVTSGILRYFQTDRGRPEKLFPGQAKFDVYTVGPEGPRLGLDVTDWDLKLICHHAHTKLLRGLANTMNQVMQHPLKPNPRLSVSLKEFDFSGAVRAELESQGLEDLDDLTENFYNPTDARIREHRLYREVWGVLLKEGLRPKSDREKLSNG
jgi:hypothetical protein